MRLLFDARYIRTDFHDGVSRYSTELGNALAALTPVTFIICDKAQLKFLPVDTDYILIHPITSVLELFTARILNKYHPDVVFNPLPVMGSRGRQFKLILTLHDLIHYRHRTPPHNLHLLLRIIWFIFHLTYMPQRRQLNNADVVATVSETCKQDFENVHITKRPIVVIPNAPNKLAELLTAPIKHDQKGPKNIIYMGSFMPYKNVETLIAGMEWLPGRTLHLLSRISPTRKAELSRLAPKGSKVIFYGGVTDKKYAQLLASNAVLVTASLEEGYGLPIAEALALGVPAVISDMPIFREVGGRGALYFESKNPKDFADKVTMLDDNTLYTKLVKAGQAHIAQFNWTASAKTLLKLVKSLL